MEMKSKSIKNVIDSVCTISRLIENLNMRARVSKLFVNRYMVSDKVSPNIIIFRVRLYSRKVFIIWMEFKKMFQNVGRIISEAMIFELRALRVAL